MTSQGRQYPDGPLSPSQWVLSELAPPDAVGAFVSALLGPPSDPGPPYVHTFAPPRPCPTHCDDDCELNDGGCHEWHAEPKRRDHDPDECEALQRPGPDGGFRMVKRPISDVVAEAGFGPVPQHVEITASFCQCPACREARCEP